MNNDIKIYISAHKDFHTYPKNDCYEIVAGEGELKNDYDINVNIEAPNKYTPMQKCINEITRMYHVWKNIDYKKHKYIGFCHYRRYFDFYDNIPDMDNLFKDADVIVSYYPEISDINIETVYSMWHNPNDYIFMRNIIINYLNITLDDIHKCENRFIPWNMFIMKSEDFDEYFKFITDVLDEFLERRNYNTIDDIRKYIEDNWELYDKNNATIDYQQRIPSFLMERATSLYIFYKFKNIKTLPMRSENTDVYYNNTTYWKNKQTND